jgi:transcriptional regulator with XRE-family HTH domain
LTSVFTEEYRTFLRLLVEARKEAGLTQQALADCLRRPQSFVSKYENGERRLDIAEFLKVAEAIGFDPCDLIRKMQGDSPRRSGEES